MKLFRPVLCLSLAGLGARPAVAEVKNPDTYTYATISDADSVDPAWPYDVASHVLILNIYEPLFTYSGASIQKLLPLIAARVPSRANGLISADGRTYTIPIRKGVLFHDGTPMTPEDVRYSLMRFMLFDRDAGPSPLLLQPLLGYPTTRDDSGRLKPNAYKDAARAVEVRGNNVILRLPAPFSPLPTILAMWAPVVSKRWAIQNGDWDGTEATLPKFNNFKKESTPFFERANGTGPFMLERWDRKNKEAVLLRNDRYWRKPAALKRVIIRAVPEFGTRKLMLEAGDADNITADWDNLGQLQNLPGVEIIKDLSSIEENPVAFFTFHVNAAGNPYIGSGKLDGNGIPPDFFSDKDVRKGFAYAFDYQGYIQGTFRGHGTQGTGCIPKGLLGHNPGQKTYAYDLALAREHFKKAWGGRVWENGFEFSLLYNSGNTPRENFCQILKRQVESLNPKFKIDVRVVEWPTFLDGMDHSRLPIFILGWEADYPDPHDFAFPLMHSKGNYPVDQKYSNPEADRLVEAALAETNPEKRKALYYKLQALEFEDALHIVPIDRLMYRAQRTWVKGWTHNPIFPDSPWGAYYYPIHKSE